LQSTTPKRPRACTGSAVRGQRHRTAATPAIRYRALFMTEVDAFYADCYEAVLGEGSAGRAVAVAHRRMERGVVDPFRRVLEVGAGSGQHRRYVTHPYDVYVETDLRTEERVEEVVDGRKIIHERADACDLDYEPSSFDRLIATCLLIHLGEPETALAKWRNVVRPGGLLTIYVPCDPGALLRLTRRFTTARKVRRLGFDHYDLVLAREHRNHAQALDVLLRHAFQEDDLQVDHWPLRIPSWNFNYFAVYQARLAGRT
jgi:phosphatidylethanolamine/phosphatidyl-N-methylethanolamine N-methyltransferase